MQPLKSRFPSLTANPHHVRTSFFARWALLLAGACSLRLQFSGLSRAQVHFETELLPILQNHCYQCHGPKQRESGYRLDLRESAFKGGDFGDPAIIAGNATASPVYRYASGAEPDLKMPPTDSKVAPLNEEQLAILKAWIDQGAVWPDAFAGSSAPTHWALLPIVEPQPPATSANPVDAFIIAKLREQQLSLSPEADRRTLIRRLSFDLIGLPPSPEEVEAFVLDQSPEAYATLVDRLLDSPHYGERWGRHWLDVARYTESQGFEYDRLRDNAWHYRDYVIKSFNSDKPYDQFMREQIAGDVMQPVSSDGIIATSLLVCGPYDQAGNNQKNATQRAITREDELEDLVAVVGQSFLGLTINCARCHAHKFDPIPHEDYYRVKAVFEGVKHGERPIAGHAERTVYEEKRSVLARQQSEWNARASALEAIGRKRALEHRDKRGKPNKPIEVIAPAPWLSLQFGGTEPNTYQLHGGAKVASNVLQLPQEGAYLQSAPITEDLREKTLEAWVALANLQQGGGAAISIESNDGSVFDAIVFGERQPKKWVAGSDGFQRTRDLAMPDESSGPEDYIHVAATYQTDGTITLYRNGTRVAEPYRPQSPLQTYRKGNARVLLGKRHTGGGRPWLTGSIQRAAIHNRALSDAEVLASFQSGGESVSQAESLAQLTEIERKEYEGLAQNLRATREQLTALDKSANAVSYVGTRVQPEPTRRLKRGEVNSPAEVVTPGGLSAITSLASDWGLEPHSDEALRRLKFAEWLTDPHNPLPARVIANRIWYHHFGRGIVSTLNDFGSSGSAPTHPELLDWLASQLIKNGWSIKSLHRLILNTATYRQSSQFNAAAAQLDADNQLLWRFSPRRLEAEAVRDAMLVASGQLNRAAGGPGFRPFVTTEFNATFYSPIDRDDPEFNRRTVYRINVNSGKDPLLDAFDCPDPSVKTPQRGITTTPLQALELMNNAFVTRMSQKMAERCKQLADGDMVSAVDYAYQLTLGRKPTTEEQARAVAAAGERSLMNVCWALLNSTEFIYVQ